MESQPLPIISSEFNIFSAFLNTPENILEPKIIEEIETFIDIFIDADHYKRIEMFSDK